MLFDKFAGYAKDKKVFGEIVEFSALKNEVTLRDVDGRLHTSKDVVVLEKIGKMGIVNVFDGDVIKDENGYLYEIQLCEDGMVQCFALNNMLEREGTPFKVTKEKLFNSGMTVVGNVYELRDKVPQTDFDFKVVKLYDGKKHTYYYALNNKDKKEVDLIKVIFLGRKALNNGTYQRKTITYDTYVYLVTNGDLVEADEQEFTDFVLSVLSPKRLNDKLQEMKADRVKKNEIEKDSFEDFEDDFEDDFKDFEVDDCDVEDWESENEWDV